MLTREETNARSREYHAANKDLIHDKWIARSSSPEFKARRAELDRARKATPEGREQLKANKRKDYHTHKAKHQAKHRMWYEANFPAISEKNRFVWREHVSPVARSIIATIELLKTDEQRQQYACWLMVLEANEGRYIRSSIWRNTKIDHFLADNDGENTYTKESFRDAL